MAHQDEPLRVGADTACRIADDSAPLAPHASRLQHRFDEESGKKLDQKVARSRIIHLSSRQLTVQLIMPQNLAVIAKLREGRLGIA